MNTTAKRKLLELIGKVVRYDIISDADANQILEICTAAVDRALKASDDIKSLLEANKRQREEIAALSNQANPAAEQMDWERAVSNVKEVLQVCMEVGWPAAFAIAELNSYIKRYDSGVRTRELYDSMMEVH